MAYEIRENLTGVNFTARRTNPSWIVIHNTANGTSAAGTAYNNTQYFKEYRGASATLFVDDGDVVWRCVRDTDTAWHCGESASRNGCYNSNSIGIEVCERADGTFSEHEIDVLAWLVPMLMEKYGIPESRVCRHHDVTGKACPWYYSDDAAWASLKSRIVNGKPQQVPGNPVNDAGLSYRAHCQSVGWLPAVRDGQTAGTTGYSKRLEALKIRPPKGWALEVSAHIQGVGWKSFLVDGDAKSSGEGSSEGDPIIGTVGEARRVESLIVRVTKRPEGDKRKVWFRVHQQKVGWKGWTPEGYASGTDGMALRLEAVQMKVE